MFTIWQKLDKWSIIYTAVPEAIDPNKLLCTHMQCVWTILLVETNKGGLNTVVPGMNKLQVFYTCCGYSTVKSIADTIFSQNFNGDDFNQDVQYLACLMEFQYPTSDIVNIWVSLKDRLKGKQCTAKEDLCIN